MALGDIRSLFSILIYLNVKSEKLTVFDDGSYTISLDQFGNELINTNYQMLKKKFDQKTTVSFKTM